MYHPTTRGLADVLKRLAESENYMSRSQGVMPGQKFETGNAERFVAVAKEGKKFLVTIAQIGE